LNKRLASANFLTISHDDRLYAYDHLGLPADFRPTRATAIRIAQQLDANFVVVGSYTMSNASGTDRIAIQARVLSIEDLRLSAPVEDGAELSRLFDAENAIAWKTARLLDPHFSVSEQSFLAASSPVPLPAFEDYIRGSSAATASERLKRLQAAVTIAPGYAAALLALGKEQYTQRDYDAAAATLAKVPTTDPLALEANFTLGLARFNAAKYTAAEQAFTFVATRLPLPEVVNNQGVALSRQGKDGFEFYQRASQADPSDEDYHYNLAVGQCAARGRSRPQAEAERQRGHRPAQPPQADRHRNQAIQRLRSRRAHPPQLRGSQLSTGCLPARPATRRPHGLAAASAAVSRIHSARPRLPATRPAARSRGANPERAHRRAELRRRARRASAAARGQ
jgi:tetratricopeptide (TPR) repeat protein